MNQNNNICPKCGQDTKIVNAGISKRTGKPYTAFVSCTSRDCKFTSPVPNQLPVVEDGTPTGTEVPETGTPLPTQEDKILSALRTLYKKIDELETKLIDKALEYEDFKREIKELLNK